MIARKFTIAFLNATMFIISPAVVPLPPLLAIFYGIPEFSSTSLSPATVYPASRTQEAYVHQYG